MGGTWVSGKQPSLGLFEVHRHALTAYASGIVGDHMQAEDVVQEAWMRFGAAYGSQPMDHPIGYLYRIVRNLAVDCRRRMARDRTLAGQTLEVAAVAVPDERASPEVEVAAREEVRLLIAAMDELPERTRLALEMRRLEGAKLRDIAERLGVSITVAHQIVADGIAHCRRRVRPIR